MEKVKHSTSEPGTLLWAVLGTGQGGNVSCSNEAASSINSETGAQGHEQVLGSEAKPIHTSSLSVNRRVFAPVWEFPSPHP
jgi:hypothetical protein